MTNIYHVIPKLVSFQEVDPWGSQSGVKMACEGVRLNREIFSCPICLDVLKDPVTVPCGHNYCMGCISAQWDSAGDALAFVCPQCRKTFAPRPVLLKNARLAAVAEELKKTRPEGPAEPWPGGSRDVACGDCICTGGGGGETPEHPADDPGEKRSSVVPLIKPWETVTRSSLGRSGSWIISGLTLRARFGQVKKPRRVRGWEWVWILRQVLGIILRQSKWRVLPQQRHNSSVWASVLQTGSVPGPQCRCPDLLQHWE